MLTFTNTRSPRFTIEESGGSKESMICRTALATDGVECTSFVATATLDRVAMSDPPATLLASRFRLAQSMFR